MASSDEDSHTMKDSQYNDQDSREVRYPHPAGHEQVGDTPTNPSEIQDTVVREGTSSPPAAVLRHRSAQLVSVDSLQIGGTNNPTFLGPVNKPTLHITQYVNLRENIPGMAGQETEDSTDQGKHPKELEEQETEDSTDQGNPPTDQPHHQKWVSFSWLCCIAVLIALVGILIFRFCPGDVEYCRKQLVQYYEKTASTIPSHPLLPSRTVDIDEVFVNLELNREVAGKTMAGDREKLSDEEMMLDKIQTVPLDTWEDLFKPEIVRESKIILSGGAGYGKTTIVGKIANVWSVKGKLAKFKLVFLLKMRQMRKSGCIIDAIFDQILPKDTDLTKSKMKDIIGNNQADIAFLLDGLDEIPSNVLESTEGVYCIKDVLRNKVLINSYVLVTTRPHMVEHVLKSYNNFSTVKILGFTIENRNKFIKSHFTDNITSGETLIERLDSIQSFHRLTEIPIISQMVCIIWKNQNSLPHNITALYTEFAKVLVKRRIADDKHWRQRMNTVLNDLGRIALNGLLDSTDKRLIFDREEFSECASSLDDGCEFGFLQRETFTSGLEIKEMVTFYHLSFQEYSAAHFLIYLHKHDIDTFHQRLEQIDCHNVRQMEMLLRFSCGQSLEAAHIILKHVQKDKPRNVKTYALFRLLLFESGSKELANELNRQPYILCNTREDRIALRFYLQSVPNTALQDVLYDIMCSSYDDVKLALDILLNVTVSSTGKVFIFRYFMSKQGDREIQYLKENIGSVEKTILSRVALTVFITDNSVFDLQVLSEGITLLSNHKFNFFDFQISKLSHDHVIRIANALRECKFDALQFNHINMHNHVGDLSPLITDSLKSLIFEYCELDDDDFPDLIGIVKAGNGLIEIGIEWRLFLVKGQKTLIKHADFYHTMPEMCTHEFIHLNRIDEIEGKLLSIRQSNHVHKTYPTTKGTVEHLGTIVVENGKTRLIKMVNHVHTL